MKPIRIILIMTASAAVVAVGLLINRKSGCTITKQIQEGAQDWYAELVRLLHEGKHKLESVSSGDSTRVRP